MGAEVRRKEDPRLITGTSSYVGDLALPGMHYVAFVRSPHAHARIKKIDASAALRRPGVFKVVTGHDIRKLCAPLPLAGAGEGGGGDAAASAGRKHYPLSIDRVRHVGEAIAAVIARASPSTPPTTSSSTGSRCRRSAIRSRRWPKARRACTRTRRATSSIRTPSRPATPTASSPRPSAW
jgi:carbon-monoxide dehydrogenase large subunit